ncbi:DNA polymerase III, delta subunit [mine drainage metagenome]|uniref:DNA-directed DNA polymerase n=1 Tax=mine drainage metagenome TaxID=410659 RepID=T0ZTN7_9ZZZZ
MKLTPVDLARAKGPLPKSIWLIAGAETVLVREALGAIEKRIGSLGPIEREVFWIERTLEPGLVEAHDNPSLFNPRRLFVLHVMSTSWPSGLVPWLTDRLANPLPETWIVVTIASLERSLRESALYRLFLKDGGVVECWPPDSGRWGTEVDRRARANGLVPTPEARALLVHLTEGNLLALEGALKVLHLGQGPGPLEADAVGALLGAASRHGPFELAEAAIGGDPYRVLTITLELERDGAELPLVLGTLAHELHQVLGAPGARVHPRKLQLYERARRRGRRFWYDRLVELQAVDLVVKGQKPGRPFEAILLLALRMAAFDWAGGTVA